jgi:hypothetical protein
VSRRPRPGALGALLGAALAAWLILPGLSREALPAATTEEGSSSPELEAKEAERLFLGFINDRRSLIRSCMFLGGVRIDEISVKKDAATARIRYRIECQEEEITLPPLTRTLREVFVYCRRGSHWEILGRASELPPAESACGPGEPASRPAPARDPLDGDRRIIAQEILAWAVLGNPPDGVTTGFPGREAVAAESPVLVSNENLGGVTEIPLAGRRVAVLAPGALLQRTVLESGGTWLQFDLLEIQGDSARIQVSLVSPVLPPPRPGGEAMRVLSRLEADFARRGDSWILTRHRPLP